MTSLKRNILPLLLAVTTVVLLPGCSQTDTSQATPHSTVSGNKTTAETISPSKSGPNSGPDLSFEQYNNKPCDILKPDQLAQLGSFKAPKAEKKSVGESCRWAPLNGDDASYSITLVANGSTIESITENVKGSPAFKESKISGYPAVSSDSTDGKGSCTTAVGTSKNSAIMVQVVIEKTSAPEYKDSCGATERLASTVIGNLRG